MSISWSYWLALLGRTGIRADPKLLGGESIFDCFELVLGQAVFGFGDLAPLGHHFFNPLRVLCGKVGEFCSIFAKVVKLPTAHFCGGYFPVTRAESTVFGEVEVERIVSFAFLFGKDGEERFPLKRVDHTVPNFCWIRGITNFYAGCHEVNEVRGLAGDGTRFRF